MTDTTYDTLHAALRATTKSVYIVNEKRPERGYNRMWKIYVLFNDGTNETIWTDDDPAALHRGMRQALQHAKAVPA